MKIAIVTLTSYGVALAKRVQQHYPQSDIYTLKNHKDEACKLIEPNLSLLTKELFEKEKILLYIMATGIVVRTIAPYLVHKSKDPAVLVMDEKGQFVISLLSGHLGCANTYANEIAERLAATPIITTSSDLNGVKAVDMLASELRCSVMDFVKAKEVTALLIERESVAILSDIKSFDDVLQQVTDPKGAIIISHTPPQGTAYGLKATIPIAWIVPKNLVAGIGCRKGKDIETIRQVLSDCLESIKRPIQSIAKIASVELKANETGLIDLAKELRIPFECYSVEELKIVEDQFEGSAFVKETIGVSSVSEPAGYIGSNKGICRVAVQKRDGVTISLWEKVDEDYET